MEEVKFEQKMIENFLNLLELVSKQALFWEYVMILLLILSFNFGLRQTLLIFEFLTYFTHQFIPLQILLVSYLISLFNPLYSLHILSLTHRATLATILLILTLARAPRLWVYIKLIFFTFSNHFLLFILLQSSLQFYFHKFYYIKVLVFHHIINLMDLMDVYFKLFQWYM